ncbi:MAG TPA: M1 family metallopeptidase [Puia sp.]|nr:M1 family metallopeptidase [Puia sp.]
MKKIQRLAMAALMLAALPVSQLTAQTASNYDPHELFGPYFFRTDGNEIRSASGQPGPKYWQNRADYLIRATLDEQDTTINGEVTIDYTNKSPDKLDFLWLQLDQNLFRPDSRGAATTPVTGDRFDVKGFSKGGYHIEAVEVTYDTKSYAVAPVISDARMLVRLHSPVRANGGKVRVKVKYSFAIPVYGADRMGRLATRNGIVYELAQWYPRMCVYDDVESWNTLPYMGLGEFYCEYGNFDYYLTAPAEMTVVASGDLQNPQEVLTAREIERLAKARRSDTTVMIVKPEEVGQPSSRPKTTGTLTWHFKMNNTRDVSWAASRAFIWDAARVNLPSRRPAIAQSAYPIESAGKDRYGRSTEYLKRSMEIYSDLYFEYPWNSAVSVAGVALGMEYPGIIFCKSDLMNGDLWGDVTHEIGHNWFPMIVGSNERRFMWQDEGLNTFINQFSTRGFGNGEYYRKPNPEFMYRIFSKEKDPLMTPPEAMNLKGYGAYYFKTAAGLNLLRDVIVDSNRFDYAFRQYIHRWAFKHPQPDDFFRTMNSTMGENLDWFWKEWFFTTDKLDQAVTSVKYVDGDSTKGALITIDNLDKMAMPVIVKVGDASGNFQVVKLPVDIWERGGSWTFKYPSAMKVTSVELDPEHVLPDENRANNVWKGQ